MPELNLPFDTCGFCGGSGPLTVPGAGVQPGEDPTEGDVSVCYWCAAITIYVAHGDHLDRRNPTVEELTAIAADPGVQHVVNTINHRNALRGHHFHPSN